jgi:XTP/dITP diphosphohydrolase
VTPTPASPLRLVVASANPHKVAEMRDLLATHLPQIELVPRPSDVPDVVEDADTLEGNALLKASALCAATGMAAVADDTGLFVERLGGDPGVRTARFAGPDATDADNRSELLRRLAALDAVADSDRRAEFRTVVIVRWPDGPELCVTGAIGGTIALQEHGDGGFGYDALFMPDGHGGATFAELGLQVKQAISHRARAFMALAEALASPPA